MRNLQDVNARRTAYRQHERSNGAHIDLPEIMQDQASESDSDPFEAFPYLENIVLTAKKHPYAMLAGIVTMVGTVLVAIASACVILFSSFFTMYGTMREMQAQQKQFIEQQQSLTNELKVMRTYNASILARQNFIAGMMTPDSQRRLNEYDKANPVRSNNPE